MTKRTTWSLEEDMQSPENNGTVILEVPFCMRVRYGVYPLEVTGNTIVTIYTDRWDETTRCWFQVHAESINLKILKSILEAIKNES